MMNRETGLLPIADALTSRPEQENDPIFPIDCPLRFRLAPAALAPVLAALATMAAPLPPMLPPAQGRRRL